MSEGLSDVNAQTRCSVLLADDDRALCRSLGDILEARRHSVEIVHSGREVLAACSRPEPFDLLILDIALPDQSGLELIPKIEEVNPELDVLVITGHANIDLAVQAVSRSTIGYLVKPLDLERLLAIHQGVAERKRVAQENRRLQERIHRERRQWRSTFDAISDPIAIVGGCGIVRHVNRAYCRLFDTTPEDSVGTRAMTLLRPPIDDSAGAAAAQRERRPREEEWSDLPVPGVFQVTCDPVDLGDEEGTAYVLRDVTEHKRVAAERESLLRQLIEKNAELERFAYTMSHDLKNPLVTIKAFLGQVEADVVAGDSERLAADLARIHGAADRMGTLFEALLELSRAGRTDRRSEEVSLARLAREAIDLLPRPNFDAEIVVSDELPVVEGDRLRLLQVLLNLIDNALKFMGEQPAPRVELGVCEIEAETVCFVRDNGIGIDPRYQDQIFRLFDQLDRKTQGTGIGLPLVQRILEVHGGRLWVESEGLGQGACFYFTLPGHLRTGIEELRRSEPSRSGVAG